MSSERFQKIIRQNDIKIADYITSFQIESPRSDFQINLKKLQLINVFQIQIKTPKDVLHKTSEELQSLMNKCDQDAEKNGFFAPGGWYVYGAFSNYYCHNFTTID